MTQFMGRFSVTAGARSLDVCRANGTHGEPDLRGRCFMCGLLLPDPELPTIGGIGLHACEKMPREGVMIVAPGVVVDLDAYYRPIADAIPEPYHDVNPEPNE